MTNANFITQGHGRGQLPKRYPTEFQQVLDIIENADKTGRLEAAETISHLPALCGCAGDIFLQPNIQIWHQNLSPDERDEFNRAIGAAVGIHMRQHGWNTIAMLGPRSWPCGTPIPPQARVDHLFPWVDTAQHFAK